MYVHSSHHSAAPEYGLRAQKRLGGNIWMLPDPAIFGNVSILEYNARNYTATDVPALLAALNMTETLAIYTDLVVPVQRASRTAPNVEVFNIVGDRQGMRMTMPSSREQPVPRPAITCANATCANAPYKGTRSHSYSTEAFFRYSGVVSVRPSSEPTVPLERNCLLSTRD